MLLDKLPFTSARVMDTSGTAFVGPMTIAVFPGSECTVKVEVSYDLGLSYSDWSPGEVTQATNATTVVGQTPTNIRVSNTAGTNTSTLVVSK